jgi:hypothetical protein
VNADNTAPCTATATLGPVSHSSSLSTGAKAGVGVGAVAGVALLVAAILALLKAFGAIGGATVGATTSTAAGGASTGATGSTQVEGGWNGVTGAHAGWSGVTGANPANGGWSGVTGANTTNGGWSGVTGSGAHAGWSGVSGAPPVPAHGPDPASFVPLIPVGAVRRQDGDSSRSRPDMVQTSSTSSARQMIRRKNIGEMAGSYRQPSELEHSSNTPGSPHPSEMATLSDTSYELPGEGGYYGRMPSPYPGT